MFDFQKKIFRASARLRISDSTKPSNYNYNYNYNYGSLIGTPFPVPLDASIHATANSTPATRDLQNYMCAKIIAQAGLSVNRTKMCRGTRIICQPHEN